MNILLKNFLKVFLLLLFLSHQNFFQVIRSEFSLLQIKVAPMLDLQFLLLNYLGFIYCSKGLSISQTVFKVTGRIQVFYFNFAYRNVIFKIHPKIYVCFLFYFVILLLRNIQHFIMAYRIKVQNHIIIEVNRTFRLPRPSPSPHI